MSAEEELLAALVASEIGYDDPRVKAALLAKPELKNEIEALRALGGRMENASRYEREAIEEQTRDPRESEHLGRGLTLEGETGKGRSVGPNEVRSRTRLGSWLAAAAVLLLVGITARLAWQSTGALDEATELTLGPEDGLGVRVAVSDVVQISWDACDLRGGRSYVLVLVDEQGKELLSRAGLDSEVFVIDDLDLWARALRIEVRLVDSSRVVERSSGWVDIQHD